MINETLWLSLRLVVGPLLPLASKMVFLRNFTDDFIDSQLWYADLRSIGYLFELMSDWVSAMNQEIDKSILDLKST